MIFNKTNLKTGMTCFGKTETKVYKLKPLSVLLLSIAITFLYRTLKVTLELEKLQRENAT